MNIKKTLEERSDSTCEMCRAKDNLSVYKLPPVTEETAEKAVLVCETCLTQIEDENKMDANHWRCLNESMWSEFKPVQILAWRMLDRLREEGWPQDLLDMLYLDEEDLAFAKLTEASEEETDDIVHRDSNGAILEAGDSVVLIKDLPVKGSSMVAKRGTAVRRISLDPDNEEYIEGKVDGQHIVIVTKFVKKL